MLKIILLICPMSMDHAACQIDTAIDVVRSMKVKSAQQCGFMGQSGLATTALVPDPKTQYLKIVCLRETDPGYSRSADAK